MLNLVQDWAIRETAALDDSDNRISTAQGGAFHIAAVLREEILSLMHGEQDRLPPERLLAERFGVARGTIRQALARLEQMGLVTRRRGSGTYVCYSDVAETFSVIRSTGPMQLIDARLAVEPHIARLAALHASGNTVYELERSLSEVEHCETESDGFSSADERFHRAVAACTRNEMLIWICKWINQVRSHQQWAEMKRLTLTVKIIAAYNRQHRAIAEAIRRRDAEAAARAATEHLQLARQSLVNAGARS